MKKSKVFLLTQTVALPKIDTLFWTTLYFILGGFVRKSVGTISITSYPNIPFLNQIIRHAINVLNCRLVVSNHQCVAKLLAVDFIKHWYTIGVQSRSNACIRLG